MPILVKAPLVSGLLKGDPALSYAGLAGTSIRSIAAPATIDPNIAYTSHALGGLAARLLASGQSVWWNPYEGVGAPLAGEMQAAALFPPTWLLLLPSGQLIEHLLFQIVAGCATFALLRRLELRALPAWFGGAAFAFNGTFAWLANAVINPVCFLPVMLLGIEWLRVRPSRAAAAAGGGLVAVGLAASLYAGFPEVAYLDGLLAGVWVVARAAADRAAAPRFLVLIGSFAGIGVMLAAPAVTPFLDYLPDAYLGIHEHSLTDRGLSAAYAAMKFVPYLPGTLFQGDTGFWSDVGGYAGIALTSLALAGGLGDRDKALRRALAGWALVMTAVTFGVAPFTTIAGLVPGLGRVAAYRYLDASIEMCLALLAAFAVDDCIAGRMSRKRIGLCAILTAAVTMLFVAGAAASGLYPHKLLALVPTLCQLLAVSVFWCVLAHRSGTVASRARGMVAATLAEIVLLFLVPTLSYPYRGAMTLGGVRFLQRHLGLQRFVSLGPIAPNYGSYFGIAQVNHNDLPVPRRWLAHLRRLDPTADPINFSPSSPAMLSSHFPAYAAIGVRYAVTSPTDALAAPLAYADPVMRVWRVPATRDYFQAPGCTVDGVDRATVEVACPRAARLERLELFMHGWTATIGGRPATITPADGLFQAVELPAGRSRVRFAFRPPHLDLAIWTALAGVIALATIMAMTGRRWGLNSPGESAT